MWREGELERRKELAGAVIRSARAGELGAHAAGDDPGLGEKGAL